MAADFSDNNLTEAFCKCVACTDFGDFASNGLNHFDDNVLVSIPAEMQDNFPERLLQCAIEICTKEPYLWGVNGDEPVINKDTLFKDLFNEWFKNLLS